MQIQSSKTVSQTISGLPTSATEKSQECKFKLTDNCSDKLISGIFTEGKEQSQASICTHHFDKIKSGNCLIKQDKLNLKEIKIKHEDDDKITTFDVSKLNEICATECSKDVGDKFEVEGQNFAVTCHKHEDAILKFDEMAKKFFGVGILD
ncbi:MAG: hypothetical protein RLZZ210_1061 [Pseudomonadota bacterium]|jgi:hypothetical protein